MTSAASLLQELVRRPSVNPMGRDLPAEIVHEKRVTDFLEERLRSLGVPLERYAVEPGRDNLVVRWESSKTGRTLLWEVHQDTVPVDRMTIEPFGGTVENGKLYGRGACDVKGTMTAMILAFERLVREKKPSANVILAFTIDEEHTSLGVKELMRRGTRADAAVVAEPTRLNIVHAHKGVSRWTLETQGRSCHSSRPQDGVNAIYRMARLLVVLEELASKLDQETGNPLLGPATLSVGTIAGGVSPNTVPDRCRIDIDRRLLPGEEPETLRAAVEQRLRAAIGDAFPFDLRLARPSTPALAPAGAEDILQRLGQAIDRVAGSHTVHPVAFCTDAPHIAAAGVPAVVFGPGDIAQAHTCDEWIELAQIDQAVEILVGLARSFGE